MKETKKDAEIGNEEEENKSPRYQEKNSVFSYADSCKEEPQKIPKEKSQLSSQESLKPRQIFEVKNALSEENPIKIDEKMFQNNENHSAGLGSNKNTTNNFDFHFTPSFKTKNEKLFLIFILFFLLSNFKIDGNQIAWSQC